MRRLSAARALQPHSAKQNSFYLRAVVQVYLYSALRNSVFALVLCMQTWSVYTGPERAGASMKWSFL
ncbi:MAG: hypothetical protein LBP35_04090 [Candidatus Ancillula trichonymphae]|nr:hypothetical protein [Candidatus Ancillula trichonymphae]